MVTDIIVIYGTTVKMDADSTNNLHNLYCFML